MLHSPDLGNSIELFALSKEEERDPDGRHEVRHVLATPSKNKNYLTTRAGV